MFKRSRMCVWVPCEVRWRFVRVSCQVRWRCVREWDGVRWTFTMLINREVKNYGTSPSLDPIPGV